MKRFEHNKILLFTWDADGIRICETSDPERAISNRKGFRGAVMPRRDCRVPDFWDAIAVEITTKKPLLVFFTTQEEGSDASYFHAEFLPEKMKQNDYRLLKRESIENTQTIIRDNAAQQAKNTGNNLRASLYILKREYSDAVKEKEKKLNQVVGNAGQMTLRPEFGGRRSAAIGAHFHHPTYGKFLFLAVDIPRNPIEFGFPVDHVTEREAILAHNRLVLIETLGRMSESLPESLQPDHILLTGHLNYNLEIDTKAIGRITSLEDILRMREKDELTEEKKQGPLRNFKEGIDDNGPKFLPTAKLRKQRNYDGDEYPCVFEEGKAVDPNCYPTEDIGWHARILYRNRMRGEYMLKCVDYYPIESDTIGESDHTALTGVYKISRN